MSGQDAGERVVELAALRTCMERALEADGMSSAHAAETADVLLDAELRGTAITASGSWARSTSG